FGDEDDAVVVVEGPGRESVVPVLEELSSVLSREDQLFHAVLHEVDLSKIRAKGLHYLSLEELRQLERFQDRIQAILDGAWSQLNLGNMLAAINYRLCGGQGHPDNQLRADAELEVARIADSLLMSLTGRGRYRSPLQEMNDSIITLSQVESEYLLTNEGRLGFVLLRMSDDKDQFARGSRAIRELRRLIAQVQARFPEAKIGLTGLPVMENDEMRASQRDTIQAGIVSLVGVACLFIAGFGGLRHPLMTVAALLLAIAWSLGYATLAV
ncbi:unnamed protein product, partial [marine sediment metagenome]